MLVATGVWVAAIVVYGGYMAATYGPAVAFHPRVLPGIFLYPSLPYGVAMIVLGVVHFAGKT